MTDYKKMYHIMVDAAENAIRMMNAQNYGMAKKALIRAEREAEEMYIQTADGEDEATEPQN